MAVPKPTIRHVSAPTAIHLAPRADDYVDFTFLRPSFPTTVLSHNSPADNNDLRALNVSFMHKSYSQGNRNSTVEIFTSELNLKGQGGLGARNCESDVFEKFIL